MPVASPLGPRRLAALLLGGQSLALMGFAAFYVYELAIGEGSDTARVLMSAVLIALGGLGLGLVARGWLGDGWWPRTPTIVWSALLLPVGWGLIQGTKTLVGWLVLVVAVTTALAALASKEPESEAGAGSAPD